MGEDVSLFRAGFNGSVRFECRPGRVTGETGALLQREVLHRLGLLEWLGNELKDFRRPDRIQHSLSELVATSVLLRGQGWRDDDDADALRDDGALRLAVSERRGVAPLEEDGNGPSGLASQPTLSRLTAMLSKACNREVLRRSLTWMVGQRVRAMNEGRKLGHLTIDIDSFPIEVHGHQPGSAHNGHYRAAVYHPIAATAAELGDLLDVRLREGRAHTAEGALDFLRELLPRVETEIAESVSVRFDAGFPGDGLLTMLEERGTPYVARLTNNKALYRLAEPHLKRPVGRPPAEPRVWLHEMSHEAGPWSHSRRAVLVVLERPGDLYLHHFWLVTSWSPEEKSAADLLALYRDRGTAEGAFGEFKDVIAPALSSSPRAKSHYKGRAPREHCSGANSYEHNEVRLLISAIAHNVLNTARLLIEHATNEGWSLRRVRERVLRVPAQILRHARYVTFVMDRSAARLWAKLWPRLQLLARGHTA